MEGYWFLVSVLPYRVCPNIKDTSDSLAEIFYLDSYLRILDFSKPIGSSEKIIDIDTDNITTAIRLPDNIPRLDGGTLFISDGVMHMLPGRHGFNNTVDANGNILNITTYRVDLPNKVWDFDLESQKWDVHASEIGDQAQWAVFAFDTRNQVGWYYGGVIRRAKYYNGTEMLDFTSVTSQKALQDLYCLDRGKNTPRKVDADSSFVGYVREGALVYIEGAGEAGILVLIGGATGIYDGDEPLVSTVDQINKPCTSTAVRLIFFYRGQCKQCMYLI